MLIALTSITSLACYLRTSLCAGKGCLNTGCLFGMDKPICHWHHHRWNEKGKRHLNYSPTVSFPNSSGQAQVTGIMQSAQPFTFRTQHCCFGLLSETSQLLSASTLLPSRSGSSFRVESKCRDQVNTAMVMYSLRSGGLEPDDLQGPFPTLTILWFYDSVPFLIYERPYAIEE